MRSRPTTLALLLALTTASAARAELQEPVASLHVSSVASFAGRWRLDVAQSRDLPPYYAGIREHRLEIAQDDSSLTVQVTLVDTAGAEQRMRFPYDLRRPVSTTTQVRTPAGPRDIPATLTAVPRGDGGLDVDIAREITMGERVIRPRDHESWHLSADGKQLLIDREAEMPGPGGLRTVRSHYVFVRT